MMNIRQVTIPIGHDNLAATIFKPARAKGIVIFSHGLGSGRFSPRNVKIANQLQDAGFATLLCDLHNPKELQMDEIPFNLNLMAQRLETIIRWLKNQPQYDMLHPAIFGSSTGAAVAIKAAADLQGVVKALICRGGRLDLAKSYIQRITTPTLLIVGELDFHLVEIHERMVELIIAQKELAIIPGASHLFEEPKKLEEVGKVSIEWFSKFLNQPVFENRY